MIEVTFNNYLVSVAKVKPQDLPKLGECTVAKKLAKGEMLQMAGEVCRHSFFVEKGLLRLYSVTDDGKEHIIQFAPEGWFISDRASVFFNEPSEYFIEAIEETSLVSIDAYFMQLAGEISAEFRQHNERLLQNHIRHLQKRIGQLLGASAEERYMDFITLYPDLMLRVPQWMIASFLGITPESLSRVRKELARKNFRR